MQTAPLAPISVQDYLEGEKTSQVRHEYVDGCVYAMTGGSLNHNTICGNLVVSLRQLAEGGPCQVYFNDVKVQIEARNTFYYPDVLLVCTPTDGESHYVDTPCLIVEVLSPSTAATDRREKLLAYRTLPSLREYVLVDSTRQRIEVFRRAGASWLHEILEPSDLLHVGCLGAALPFDAIYRGVDLPIGIAEEEALYG